MKHIFVVNPAAGKGRAEKEYLPKIQQAVKKERGTQTPRDRHCERKDAPKR